MTITISYLLIPFMAIRSPNHTLTRIQQNNHSTRLHQLNTIISGLAPLFPWISTTHLLFSDPYLSLNHPADIPDPAILDYSNIYTYCGPLFYMRAMALLRGASDTIHFWCLIAYFVAQWSFFVTKRVLELWKPCRLEDPKTSLSRVLLELLFFLRLLFLSLFVPWCDKSDSKGTHGK